MTKQELLQDVIKTIMQAKENAEQSFAVTRQAAIEAPGAMESHSDTTKSQMSRFAEKIQESIDEKEFAIRTLRALAYSGLPSNPPEVRIGSIVRVLTQNNEQEVYFILSVGGGTKITDSNVTISVITPQTPLAKALIGRRLDETTKLQIGSRVKELKIVDIQ